MRADNTRPQCPICHDVLDLNDTYALLCGHTFHDRCITKWLDNPAGQTCPCCRVRCPKEHLLKVYFDFPEAKGGRKNTKEGSSQSQVDRSTAFLNHQRKETARLSGNTTSPAFDPLDFPYSRFLNGMDLLPHEPFVCGLDEPILWLYLATVFLSLAIDAPASMSLWMCYTTCTLFSVVIYCTNTTATTPGRMGFRNFSVSHELLYTICVIALALFSWGTYLCSIDAADFCQMATKCLLVYRVVYTLVYDFFLAAVLIDPQTIERFSSWA